MRKTTQFKRLLLSDSVEFLMEAHNGLSARIVEEAGFKGIWASGLSISAALGVRDNNEASWTQVLEVVEFMSDVTTIPILLDADTGYGNFNNVRRLVRKLEQRHVAAMCIEDKLFPKTNSFIGGEQQPLADIEEFAGKIKAAKDTQQDPDFCVVARVEAFIAGWGLAEALKRAEAYYRAGADAILMHSKLSSPDQILAFMREWTEPCPVVIVPTMYYNTPVQVFQDAGVSVVIWANHLLRSSITTMQRTAARIYAERSIGGIESEIVPVKEVFRLQNADELKAAERRYLPVRAPSSRAVILAPSNQGGRHGNGRPAIGPSMAARSFLQELVAVLQDAGIKEITLALPGDDGQAAISGVKSVVADPAPGADELALLAGALGGNDTTTIVALADIRFKKRLLASLQDEPGDIVLVVEANAGRMRSPLRRTNFVRCSAPSSSRLLDDPVELVETEPALPDGEWIGLMKLSPRGVALVREAIASLRGRADFGQLRIKDLFDELLARKVAIQVVYTTGYWVHAADLELFPSVA